MSSYHATLRSLRQSPRKVRLLSDALVGLSVPEAQARLAATRKASATPLAKLLRSAAANAAAKDQIAQDDLSVKSVRVDGGAVLKRFHPRAFGRAAPIRRRSSHISVELLAKEGAKKMIAPKAAAAVSQPKPEAVKTTTSQAATSEPKVQKKIESKVAKQGFMRRFFQRKSGM